MSFHYLYNTTKCRTELCMYTCVCTDQHQWKERFLSFCSFYRMMSGYSLARRHG